MDRFAEKQKQINQRRAEISKLYPALWSKMIAEWKQPDSDDQVWLMYSANYLFRTNNIRWAMDPLTLYWIIKDTPEVNVAHDLSDLSFVLLTHDHKDHLDLELISALRDLPITWIIPEFLLPKVMNQTGLPREKIIVPSPLDFFEFNGIHILPFDGLHWETTSDGNLKGVPALGYLIECNGKRFLFPGDTRAYDSSKMPMFDSVDIAFAHLWLGRGTALMGTPPLLDAFRRFFLDLKPGRVILTHLTEFGRDANDFWDESHVQVVQAKFNETANNISISPVMVGEQIVL